MELAYGQKDSEGQDLSAVFFLRTDVVLTLVAVSNFTNTVSIEWRFCSGIQSQNKHVLSRAKVYRHGFMLVSCSKLIKKQKRKKILKLDQICDSMVQTRIFFLKTVLTSPSFLVYLRYLPPFALSILFFPRFKTVLTSPFLLV